jgi:hypothetical protein
MIQKREKEELMEEGQKKRQIGKGMKPRGNKRFKTQKGMKKVTNQSTNEGQAQGAPEPVLEAEVRNETPGNLEPENGENSLQNLEKNEAIVAHDDALEESSEAGNELLAALNESAGERVAVKGSSELKNQAHVVIEDGKVTKSREYVDLETAMAVGTGTVKELAGVTADRKYAIGVDYGGGPEKGVMAVIKAGEKGKPDELVGTFEAISLGLQPDGSKKYVVEVVEGYWTAVEDWAQGDGITPEEWLRNLLYGAISTYGEPAKGR